MVIGTILAQICEAAHDGTSNLVGATPNPERSGLVNARNCVFLYTFYLGGPLLGGLTFRSKTGCCFVFPTAWKKHAKCSFIPLSTAVKWMKLNSTASINGLFTTISYQHQCLCCWAREEERETETETDKERQRENERTLYKIIQIQSLVQITPLLYYKISSYFKIISM